MEPKKRRIFDKEFKQRTVELIKQGDKKVKEVALDLDIEPGDIYRWIREFNRDPEDSFPGKGKLKPEDEEFRRLKRQLADVTEERDILKKAVAIFSKVKR
jgi:transposase